MGSKWPLLAMGALRLQQLHPRPMRVCQSSHSVYLSGSLGAPSGSPRPLHQPLALSWEEHSLGDAACKCGIHGLAQPPVRNLSSEPGAAGLPGIFRKVRLGLLPVPYKV